MKTRALLLTVAATLTLAACNNDDHTIVAGGPVDPMANELQNAAPVELPPAIAATKRYRCKDNSLVSIDWLEKNGQPAGANLRVGEGGNVNVLQPGADGKGPFTAADGTKVAGTKDASSVEVTLAGKGAQSCKA